MSFEPLLDLMALTPVYADELSIVKTMAGVTFLVFSSRQPDTSNPEKCDRVVQLRLIVPTDALNTMARAMLAREAAVRNGDQYGDEKPLH